MDVKERPILFSAPMVRAVLDGRKTQTRRVVRLRFNENVSGPNFDGLFSETKDPVTRYFACPYGAPGDRLWVRETWGYFPGSLDSERQVLYRATVSNPPEWDTRRGDVSEFTVWRPSIHLPRWASRINLKVKAIRVERIQDISAKDILAEGAVARPHEDKYLGKCPVSAFDGKVYPDLKSVWAAGWDGINGKRGFGWTANPWVWVVEFEKVEESAR